jgi:hypothetical protein
MDPDTPRRPWWALVAAVVALATAVGLVVGDRPAPSESMAVSAAAMEVAPGGEVELASLPADHRHLYEAAADDEDAFSAVRCYCGCEAFLGHATLLECFVRPQGGWERHATGCAVCLGEARDVVKDRQDGLPLDEIVDRIDRRYGGITQPATT